MRCVYPQCLTLLRHCLLCQLDQGLFVWRSRTWKKLNGIVLRAEHVTDEHSIDIVLCDDGALELGEVEAVAKSRLIELSLVANGLADVAYRVLRYHSSLSLCHSSIQKLLSIDTY